VTLNDDMGGSGIPTSFLDASGPILLFAHSDDQPFNAGTIWVERGGLPEAVALASKIDFQCQSDVFLLLFFGCGGVAPNPP
jgi:hypothetical protein